MRAAIFWHSAVPGVFAGQCRRTTWLVALALQGESAEASGYPSVDAFTSYPVTGDAADSLSLVGIPAIEVDLADHSRVEFDRNLVGVLAVLERLEAIGKVGEEPSNQR